LLLTFRLFLTWGHYEKIRLHEHACAGLLMSICFIPVVYTLRTGIAKPQSKCLIVQETAQMFTSSDFFPMPTAGRK
jgi:hypothetical protein